MRRPLLALSLAVNLGLATVLYLRLSQPLPEPAPPEIIVTTNTLPPRSSVVVRRQFFNWNQIESDDYPTFIANLRQIGCPEITIRDIITADVNQLFAQRRAIENDPPDMEWWKSEPNPDHLEAAFQKMAALERERTNLLAKLLGPNWNVNFTQASEAGSVNLTGPVLGKLDPSLKLKIQELSVNSARRVAEYAEAQRVANKPIDPAALARLRQAHRDELAKVLSPLQLEEYLLRYSSNAEILRQQLRGFDATPDEFRAIFRARDKFDNDIQLHYSGNDPASIKTRQDLEKVRDDAVATALGPERSALYRAMNDPIFRQAQLLAQQTGAGPDKVIPLYQIQVESDRERARIASDASLSAVERASALRAVEVEEEEARRKLLGLSTSEN